MSLTRVGLSISLSINSDCTSLLLTDSTGSYNATTNPLGYGLPGGITANNVGNLIVTINIEGGTYFTYNFAITSSVIATATLSVNSGTASNILSELSSTVFPLTSFDLFADYGVTLPSFEDGIINVDYNILGDTEFNTFDYTTSSSILIPCDTCCCVNKMSLDIDTDCDCSSDKMWEYLRATTYLDVAKFNVHIGKNSTAQLALNKAKEICDCSGCSDC